MKQVLVLLRPAASYVSHIRHWGAHSFPSRSSNRRRSCGILSYRRMLPSCIQRSSPRFWCTPHFVCTLHRRSQHLQYNNTDHLPLWRSHLWFNSRQTQAIFSSFSNFRAVLGHTPQPLIQCVVVGFSREVKRPEHETDNLPIASLPHTPSCHPQNSVYFFVHYLRFMPV